MTTEQIGLRPQPTDFALAAVARCAPATYIAELSARRDADNTPSLKNFAFKDLSKVVTAVNEHDRSRIRNAERGVLEKCPAVRDKLLQLELSRAAGQFKWLGIELNEGGVWRIAIGNGSSTKLAETSTQAGRIEGWLLEATNSKAFDQGVQLFSRNTALIEWLRANEDS